MELGIEAPVKNLIANTSALAGGRDDADLVVRSFRYGINKQDAEVVVMVGPGAEPMLGVINLLLNALSADPERAAGVLDGLRDTVVTTPAL